MQHSRLDSIDRLLTHLFVRLVPPPYEHVGVHQEILGQAILWLVERCRAHGQVGGCDEPLGDRAMNPVWIDRSVAFVLSFVPVFIPDGDPNLIHSAAPNLLWRMGALTTPPSRLPLLAQPSGRSP